jgi:murein DD-endopeptidase MepM/ murein hydrolase activator NlpD
MNKKLNTLFHHLAHDFGSIIMVGNYHIGFFIILAAFLQPNIIISGLLGLLITIIMTKILGIDKSFSVRTTIYCNALLLGLYIGYLYVLGGMSILLLLITMALNLVFCFASDSLFSLMQLPLLSFPFSIISLFLSLSFKKFTAISSAHYYFHEFHPEFFSLIPDHFLLFFKTIGTFFCIPDTGFGLLLLLSVIIYSPLTALFLTLGFFLGISFEKMFAFTESEYVQQHYYFNFSLIFTGIAGIFLLPSFYSLLWAIFATLITVILSISLSSLFNYAEIPVMALPFNLAAFFVLRTIKTISPRKLNVNSGLTPENSLEINRLLKLRHRDGEIGVFSPVAGDWAIQQGHNDEWTHTGKWKHALDFVITKKGITFKNDGLELEDYYCYEKPIYAPVSGVVVNQCNHHNDNKIEEVDNQNNWGNYIIIRSDYGHFVVLAHLKKESVITLLGQYVTAGQEIARCGNSGYSREPHLHLQVQWTQLPGGYTTPFHLMNYFIKKENRSYYHGVPLKGQTISPFVFNHSLYRALSFKIGEKKRWVMTSEFKKGEVIFENLLDPISGKTYWSDGVTKLYYTILGAKFYFYEIDGDRYSPIWDLFLAAPSIPLHIGDQLRYVEEIPLKLTHHPLNRFIKLTTQLITGGPNTNRGRYRIDPTLLSIEGEVNIKNQMNKTTFKIDPHLGIMSFSVGKNEYRLIHE